MKYAKILLILSIFILLGLSVGAKCVQKNLGLTGSACKYNQVDCSACEDDDGNCIKRTALTQTKYDTNQCSFCGPPSPPVIPGPISPVFLGAASVFGYAVYRKKKN